MKTHFKTALIFVILAFVFVAGCQKDYLHRELLTDGNYQGTFYMTGHPDKILGTVTLHVSNGIYECGTNLPYNYGAGYLEITGNTLNFQDTLFYIVPAIYITGYSLSGECNYIYDGNFLEINRPVNGGEIIYQMIRKNE